ncbi:MAG: tetratricopeptide repeat protein [Saprospiraceae bacterium]|nr:tetratricopeptide repeat protein [Saprospiraceae bacterium]
MKTIIFGIAVLLGGSLLHAQEFRGAAPAKTGANTASGTTWAIVAGISDYQDANIPKLNYAHRDAEVFAKYLQSPSGGSLDNEHLYVLLNEQATGAELANALFGLIKKVKEGDQVIIYFSGHGDVEATLEDQPGYLLCWDSPPNVYMSGGTLELDDLKKIVKTLALKKVRVLLITDACRAGKLAGSANNGSQVAANNMKALFSNEIKILSCQPDQLSQESPKWGGGRGVFSYYLMQGLEGKADRDADGNVDLQEIDLFLYDHVREATQRQQIPVTVGDKTAIIAKSDPAVLAALHPEKSDQEELGLVPDMAKSMAIEQALAGDPALLAQYQAFKKAIKEGILLDADPNCAWSIFERIKDKPLLAQYQDQLRHSLASALESRVQQAINDYLKSDPNELRKRWNKSDQYEHFPEYLAKADELLGPDNPSRNNLQARFHYFTGLNYRLRGERSKTMALYKLALAEQQKCLSLEPSAAYAYNEMGLLERRNERFKEAVGNFEKAISYSPGWALPWANLCTTNNMLESYGKAEIAGKQALKLDSNLVSAHYNLGNTYVRIFAFDKAEFHYNKVLQLDPDFADSYFKLGYVYYTQNKFANAERAWLEYAKRDSSEDFFFVNLGEVSAKLGKTAEALRYFQKALSLNPDSDPAYHSLGQFHLLQGNIPDAEAAFQRYVQLQPTSPVGYYFLAQIARLKNQPEAVQENLRLASERDKDFSILRESADLESLRLDKNFGDLLARELPGWKQ